MILERILKKLSNTKNNGYCTTRKKGTLPFFYNVLQEFTEKLKYHNKKIIQTKKNRQFNCL